MRAFAQVDVFTTEPLLGNPVAVVLDADGLSTEQMQAFTDWTNLSEATFVLPPTHPDADYRVRIFCPGRELPFAGHPTLGTCHAWLAAGGLPKGADIIQECGAGLVHIRRAGEVLAFAAPPLLRAGPLEDAQRAELVTGLGLQRHQVVDHQWCDNGPPWEGLLLDSAETVLAVRPDPHLLANRFIGLIGPRSEGETAFEVRAFFPAAQGLGEDPVTGSLNAALAQWLIGSERAPRHYVAAQGTALGRSGRVHIERIGDAVWVGGGCVTVIDGTVNI